MKKQNRNMLAYTRQQKHHSKTNKKVPHDKTQIKSANSTFYEALMDQLQTNQCQYIQKLMKETEQHDKMKKKQKGKVGHERTKSYANILGGGDEKVWEKENNQDSKCRSKRKHSIKGNIFHSLQPSPLKDRSVNRTFEGKSKNQRKTKPSREFLTSLDQYIEELTHQDSKSQLQDSEELENREKQYLYDNDPQARLKYAEKRIRQLKKSNQKMKLQENKQLRKNIQLKEQLDNLKNYADGLTLDLEEERFERKKMEIFLKDIEQKFKYIRPERKTIAFNNAHYVPKNQYSHLMSPSQVSETSTHLLYRSPEVFRSSKKNLSKLKYPSNQYKTETIKKFFRGSQCLPDSDESQSMIQ